MINGNLFSTPKKHQWKNNSDEIAEILLEKSGVKIEKISSRNYKSPEGFWYDQKEDEFVTLLTGEATIEFFNGTKTTLMPGDYIIIPKHTRHRIAYTSRKDITNWLTFFYM